MSGMRLPLTLSTAGHAILFALLVLLVAEPRPPEPLVKGGIEVVLGQSLSQPQAVLAPGAGNPTARSSRAGAATAAQARRQAAGENGRAPAATASNCLCADRSTEPARRRVAGRERGIAIYGGPIGRGRRDACNCPGTGSHPELSGNDQRLVRGPQILSRCRASARRGGKRRAALSG